MADDQQRAPSEFDPRYDPAFQRGYRPQPGEKQLTRVRASSAPPIAPVMQIPRRTDPDDRAVSRPERVEPSSPSDRAGVPSLLDTQPTLPVSGEAVRGDTAPVAGSPLDRLDLSPRRNPLMLALWIVAAGFVIIGVIIYAVSVSFSYSNTTPSNDIGTLVLTQLGWMLAGPLITIGLATLVALLFLTALAGRGRGPSLRPDEDAADATSSRDD